jgi:D-glycero-D-manno-heptose 1,7-bisphosphate phosphatase
MGIDALNQRAVFLDRDGVLNHNWLNPFTGAWESPIAPDDLKLCDGALEAMSALQSAGYLLFLISNQPSAAKGKCTLDDLHSVHAALVRNLDRAGIRFARFFYAYGHPQAVVPALCDTKGRKPDPYFVNLAVAEFGLDPETCWMVGDRDSDIECGQRAGLRTIQVEAHEPDGKQGAASPDFRASALLSAARVIVAHTSDSYKCAASSQSLF